MKIHIIAKPKKKQEKVEKLEGGYYAVSVKEPATEGRANQAIIKTLAKYFSVSPSEIDIVSGHTGNIKTVEIPDSLANFEPLPKQKPLL